MGPSGGPLERPTNSVATVGGFGGTLEKSTKLTVHEFRNSLAIKFWNTNGRQRAVRIWFLTASTRLILLINEPYVKFLLVCFYIT